MLNSENKQFNQVREFHAVMDGKTQDEPQLYSAEAASHRVDFKLEELVEFLRATTDSQEEFNQLVAKMHRDVDKAVEKVEKKTPAQASLIGQVDALVDLLYFTYGSFALMGVDPEPIFQIVHRANMGKIFPDGKAHYDPVTHKILKPDNWEENYAPEPAIQAELERQIKKA